jgi:HEAT repeat protein
MSIAGKLASSLGRRDETPNVELAKQIASSGDKKSVKELAELLSDKDKNIQSDAIKVLYEIGEQKPELIAGCDGEFLALLTNKNNRLVWGALTALDAIAAINPDGIYKNLKPILAAADAGSVIAKDHAVGILIKLAMNKKYAEKTMPHLFKMLKASATNQLPMYAENAMPAINDKYKKDFVKILSSRLGEIEKESKQKRVEKVIKKMSK